MGQPYTRNLIITGQIPFRFPIIMYDDCEGTLKWTFAGTPTVLGEKRSSICYNGTNCIAMTPRIAGGAAGDSVTAERSFPMPPAKTVEFSLYFYPYVTANINDIMFNLNHYNGTALITTAIIYNTVTHAWQYVDSAGNRQNITDANITLLQAVWHKFRAVFNFSTLKYVSFEINNAKYDLSSYALRSQASATGMNSNCQIFIDRTAAGVALLAFDDILISQVETF